MITNKGKMKDKRITILSGHYGSGKTNIAVNIALDLKTRHERVAVADIDIVNPYFRTKDSEELFQEKGIRLICSSYANTNVDIPALPQDIYAITDDRDLYCVLDVGGDERGALALGRIAPKIAEENDYEMLYVLNTFRPLTRDVESAIEVMQEIECACKLKFTAVVNNSNLGAESTDEDIIKTIPLAKEVAERAGIPMIYTTVHKLSDKLTETGESFRQIILQKHM